MAMLARTPAQIVAAEATHLGGDEARFSDMLGIASVVANRALMTGVTPQQVVGVQSQFNAYNKAMPPGAQRYIDMAQKAIDDVEENGPVNSATYFATPAAMNNLPGGLTQVDQVEQGHVYFSDPLSRPIKTKLGTMSVDSAAFDQKIAAMTSYVPTPEARPDMAQVADASGFDMGRFGDVATPATANFDAGRFGQAPAAAFDQERFGPAQAADPFASVMNPIGAMPSAEMGAAPDLGAASTASALSAAGFADRFGAPDAASNADQSAPSSFDASRFGDVNAANFDSSRFGAPDPGAAVSAAVANAVANNPALGAEVGATGDVATSAMPGASAVANVTQSAPTASQDATSTTAGLNTPEGIAGQYAAYGAGQISPEVAAAQSLNDEVNSTKVDRPTAIDAANAVPGITDDISTADITTSVPVTTTSVTQAIAPAAFMARPTVTAADANKTLSAPGATAGQVWSGTAQTGIATDGSTVSRMDDGTVGRYNPAYDHTEYTNSDGSYGGIDKGNTLGTAPASKALDAASANDSLSGKVSTAASKFGDSVFSGGTLGALAGALAGSAVAGPVGGVAGGVVGRKLGGQYLGDGVPDQSPIKSLFSMFAPQVTVDKNGFPSAPSTGLGGVFGLGSPSGGLNSYGQQVASQSGQFGGAVSSGSHGLW